jgi:hypothetical protein
MDASISEAGVGNKVQKLMRETDLERHVPQHYLQTLTTILATDRLPDTENTLLEELRKTLNADQLESRITDIIDEISRIIPQAEQGEWNIFWKCKISDPCQKSAGYSGAGRAKTAQNL